MADDGGVGGVVGTMTWTQRLLDEKSAYEHYLATRIPEDMPALIPSPAKPWYASSALWGALLTIIGAAAGIAGWDINAEALAELLPAIITLLGGLAAWVGTVRRKAPIDPTLVARIGTHDLRLPSRMHNTRVPADDSRGAFRDH